MSMKRQSETNIVNFEEETNSDNIKYELDEEEAGFPAVCLQYNNNAVFAGIGAI